MMVLLLYLIKTFNFYEIGPAEILDIINEFSHKKATGPDTILIRALKENKLVLVPILAHLVNLVIVSGIFPNCMKIARVKPLFKKGDKLSCNNYRPISVLNPVSKVVEKVLPNQMREFLESNNLLTDFQYGLISHQKRGVILSLFQSCAL